MEQQPVSSANPYSGPQAECAPMRGPSGRSTATTVAACACFWALACELLGWIVGVQLLGVTVGAVVGLVVGGLAVVLEADRKPLHVALPFAAACVLALLTASVGAFAGYNDFMEAHEPLSSLQRLREAAVLGAVGMACGALVGSVMGVGSLVAVSFAHGHQTRAP